MMLRAVLTVSLLAASALAACGTSPTLELAVVNDSDSDAVVEVLGPNGAPVGFREVVSAFGGIEVAMEVPGPGGWGVTVDGHVVTDGDDWPNGNPVIDLTVVIAPDGSVQVHDTSRRAHPSGA